MAGSDNIGRNPSKQALQDGRVTTGSGESTSAQLPVRRSVAALVINSLRMRCAPVTKTDHDRPSGFRLLVAGALCCLTFPTDGSTAANPIVTDIDRAQAVMALQVNQAGAAQAHSATTQSGTIQNMKDHGVSQAAAAPISASGAPLARSGDGAPSNKQLALAETLLFQTNHLRNVPPASVLMYAFRKTGSLEPGFDDQVKLLVKADHGAGHAATMLFLSGARQRQSPEVEDPEGNPVLLGFLERDIAEMHRLTGGSTNYFRKRIRLALADAAQVRPYRFTYGGAPAEGREVVVEPYRNDPMHERFEAYTQKRYVFIISPHVPGGVYQVRATVPGSARDGAAPSKPAPPVAAERAPATAPAGRDTAATMAGSKPASAITPLVDETLTLVSVDHGKR